MCTEILKKFNDPKTFFEFMQSIKINADESEFYMVFHKNLTNGEMFNAGHNLQVKYRNYCEDLVTLEKQS